MTESGSSQDGRIGYKRPPIQTRFQKGQSGNPRGRQKGVRNFAVDVRRSLEIPVTLNDKGRPRRVSTQEALMLRLREKALKGDTRALETLLSLAETHNGDEAPDRLGDEKMLPEDQAILDAFAEELRSRSAAGAELAPDASRRGEGRGDE
jgi:hypothetical protein